MDIKERDDVSSSMGDYYSSDSDSDYSTTSTYRPLYAFNTAPRQDKAEKALYHLSEAENTRGWDQLTPILH